MRRESFTQAELAVELHLSVHPPVDLTWWDWTGVMHTHMRRLGGCMGERPPADEVRAMAADAVALLAAVLEAEEVDPLADAA